MCEEDTFMKGENDKEEDTCEEDACIYEDYILKGVEEKDNTFSSFLTTTAAVLLM